MINKADKIVISVTKEHQFKAHVRTLEGKTFTVIVGGEGWEYDPKIQQYKKRIIIKCRNIIKTLEKRLEQLPDFLKRDFEVGGPYRERHLVNVGVRLNY